MKICAVVLLCFCAAMLDAFAASNLQATVASANNNFIADLVRGDAAAAAAPFAADAIFITPKGVVIRGRDAIAAMLKERLKAAAFLGGRCTTKTLDTDGSTAWETGTCTYLTLSNGRKRTSRGHFMTVWKLSGPGEWQIAVNVAS